MLFARRLYLTTSLVLALCALALLVTISESKKANVRTKRGILAAPLGFSLNQRRSPLVSSMLPARVVPAVQAYVQSYATKPLKATRSRVVPGGRAAGRNINMRSGDEANYAHEPYEDVEAKHEYKEGSGEYNNEYKDNKYETDRSREYDRNDVYNENEYSQKDYRRPDNYNENYDESGLAAYKRGLTVRPKYQSDAEAAKDAMYEIESKRFMRRPVYEQLHRAYAYEMDTKEPIRDQRGLYLAHQQKKRDEYERDKQEYHNDEYNDKQEYHRGEEYQTNYGTEKRNNNEYVHRQQQPKEYQQHENAHSNNYEQHKSEYKTHQQEAAQRKHTAPHQTKPTNNKMTMQRLVVPRVQQESVSTSTTTFTTTSSSTEPPAPVTSSETSTTAPSK